MIQTQKNIFNIMASTNANGFIYFFKRIPVIGKALPDSIYAKLSLKKNISVIATIFKMISKLFGKAIYIGLMIILPILFMGKSIAATARFDDFLYLFFILSLICGSFQTSDAFAVSRDKFICIRLMRMRARDYILSTLLFRNIMDTLYFLPSLVVASVILHGSALQGIFLTVLFCGFRFMGELFHLLVYKKTDVILSGKISRIVVFDLLCLAAAYVPVLLRWPLSLAVFLTHPVSILICAVLGAISVFYIIHFDQYNKIAVITVKSTDFTKDTSQIMSQAKFSDVAVREKEFSDSELKSNKYEQKKGFRYLNAIFFERHRRLLIKPILIRLAVILVLFFAAVVTSLIMPQFIKPLSNSGVILPAFVFIMYFASIGEKVCKAMFYNCDNSLLKYQFYRDKNAILSNFKVRLIRVALLNLIVATAISAAVVGLIVIFRLNWPVLDTVSFVLSILFLSLFFSVHHLFLYYVFQPYSTELSMKNPFYSIINYAVYFLCFFCMKLKSPPAYFTLIILSSTFIYIVAALILVYRYAPKTFRVK